MTEENKAASTGATELEIRRQPWLRPIRGWRAFAGEVGVIVLGVLLALAAQQVAEAIDWRQRTRVSEAAIKDELFLPFANALEWRTVRPCVDAQLAALLAQLGTERALPVPAWSEPELADFVVRAPSRLWSDSAWQSAINEGVATHFDKDYALGIGVLYDTTARMAEEERDINKLLARLSAMAQPIPLDGTGRLLLAQDIVEARSKISDLALAGEQTMAIQAQMGLAPTRALLERRVSGSGTIPSVGSATCHWRRCRAGSTQKGLPRSPGRDDPVRSPAGGTYPSSHNIQKAASEPDHSAPYSGERTTAGPRSRKTQAPIQPV